LRTGSSRAVNQNLEPAPGVESAPASPPISAASRRTIDSPSPVPPNLLPMDDCLAQVAVDFGGRNWLVWEAEFKREKIGDMPTEMFLHFFKSFSDGAKANLNVKAEGTNEHHKIEAIFKAFAKAVKMAVKRDAEKQILPSTKGVL
jgi:imidazoleglycerol phosphate dehydratase HisB